MGGEQVIGIDARLYAGDATGIGVYTRGLVNGLVRLDAGRRYLLFSDRPFEPPAANASVVEIPVRKRVVWTQLGLPLWGRGRKVALYHATANHEVPVAAPFPTVVTMHDLIPLLFPHTVPARHRFLFRLLVGRAAGRSAAVITDSECVRKSLVERFGLSPSRVRAIPLAPDPSFLSPVAPGEVERIRLEQGIKGKYVLYLGATEPRKNIPALIRAFASAVSRPDLRDWQLVLAGTGGWHRGEIMRRVEESGLGERLVVTGYVPAKDLPGLYRGAELFVYPSIYEGFGLPVLEAMAAGTAVLVSSPSALEEITAGSGATFALDEPGSLGSELMNLMRSPERREALALAGRERAGFYSWEKTARATLEVYERVLGEAPPR